MLAKALDGEYNLWDQHLASVRFAHNITIKPAIRTSPFMLMHGRWPTLNIDANLNMPITVTRDIENEINDLTQKIVKLESIAYDNIRIAQNVMAEQYNKHCSNKQFFVGQHVWLYVYKLSNQYMSKFAQKFIGPFIVTKCENLNVWLQEPNSGKELKSPVHVNRLKPYVLRKIQPPIPLIIYSDECQQNNAALAQELDELSPSFETTGETMRTDTSAVYEKEAQPINKHNNENTELKLPHPSNDELLENQQRPINEIPKAMIRNNIKHYYIIYADDVNNGSYVAENDLTNAEKLFIQEHANDIRVLR